MLCLLYSLQDWNAEALHVYGGNEEHPAIQRLRQLEKEKVFYGGGSIIGLKLSTSCPTPAQVRQHIVQNGWSRVVAFQTRNPMHRAHFELTRRAMMDCSASLLLHPIVGTTQKGDIEPSVRMQCLEAILPRYPQNQVLLAGLPLAMRMAGPREAVWHALIRKNFGATHFIIGRDHAGTKGSTGDFYGPFDAQQLAKSVEKELDICIVSYGMIVYLPEKQKYALASELKGDEPTLKLSGTEVRRRLKTGEDIPVRNQRIL